MKKRFAGLVVVLFSLFIFGVANADIEFVGVLDPKNTAAQVDSLEFIMPDTTFLTPDWGSQTLYDTFIFTGITAWPETLRLYGTVSGLPVQNELTHPKPDTWYRLSSLLPITPFVMFYGDYGIEESEPAAGGQPRLAVSPSVVVGQMTIKLQPVGNGRPMVEMHDAVGNVVRSLVCTAGADGVATTTWDRKDESGRLVPEGIYFCRYAVGDIIAVRKVLVAH